MADKQTQWPADKIERRKLSDLLAYPRNARMHSPEQVKQIAASIQQWGWTVPILVDEADVIIAGHGRAQAAEELGIEVVPVIVARGWSEPQKQAYRIADNQLTISSEWNTELLKVELGDLSKMDFDLKLIGFPQLQLVEFMSGLGNGAAPSGGLGSLAEEFGVPPFSVLNAREGWWQDRKRAWIALGIQSELGRGENLVGRSPQELFCHMTGIPHDQARAIVEDDPASQAGSRPGGEKFPRGGGR